MKLLNVIFSHGDKKVSQYKAIILSLGIPQIYLSLKSC